MRHSKLEQAARALLAHWDTPAWKYLKPTGDLMADLREALAEQATVSDGLCGGCAKKAADGWALYCVECWEQTEQEPVAYRVWDRMGGISYRRTKPSESEYVEWDSLYASPVRTKDLTDDEISKIWDDSSYGDSGIDFARAVIAADREKNKCQH